MAKDRDSIKNEVDLYVSSDQKPAVQYELVKVPLQDQVSMVRKYVSQVWTQVHSTVKSTVSSVRVKSQDQLLALGVKNPATVMKVTAVGSAGLFTLFLARKKSTFKRIVYPVLVGGIVWDTIYFSNPNNRKEITDTIQSEFSKHFPENFKREFEKNKKEFDAHKTKREDKPTNNDENK